MKKIFSITIMLLMFIINTSLAQFAGGDGSAETPYIIETPEQLDNVRNFLSAHFELGCDIDLNVAPYNQGSGWEPIGDYNTASFTGTFNGANFKIKGLFIYHVLLSYDIGLFGVIGDGGYVRNLFIENVEINIEFPESDYIGSVAGYNNIGGTIENCHVTGKISGYSIIGGIVGSNAGAIERCHSDIVITTSGDDIGCIAGSNRGSIEICYSTVDISGKSYIGGITGNNNYGGLIKNCYYTGDVSGDSWIGGIAGSNEKVSSNIQASKIENCYTTGVIKGSGSNVGGIAGWNSNSEVSNCAALNSNVTGASNFGRVVGLNSGTYTLSGNVAFNKMIVGNNTVTSLDAGSRQGADIDAYSIKMDASIDYRFTEPDWTTAENQLPGFGATIEMPEHLIYIPEVCPVCGQEICICPTPVPPEITTPSLPGGMVNEEYSFTLTADGDTPITWKITGGNLPKGLSLNANTGVISGKPKQAGPFSIVVNASNTAGYDLIIFTLTIDGAQFAGGEGTEEAPYIIETPEQLDNVRNFLSAHFELGCDIDLNVAPYNQVPGWGWEPIGDYNTASFTGTFNGANFKIKGLFIDRVLLSYDVGLFGVIGDGGSVRNLFIENVDINIEFPESDYIGSVAGYNNIGGTIENCHVTGKISGYSIIGGIVGSNAGAIERCHSDIVITTASGGDIGCIAGSNKGSIERCYSTVDISGNYNIGGITGNNNNGGSIKNCYYTGNVSGDSYIGGIAGSNTKVGSNIQASKIENCYTTGVIKGSGSNVGGIAGWNSNSEVSNCAALNSNITGASNFGRVVGLNAGTYTLSGNVAFDKMIVGNNTVTSLDAGSRQGADIHALSINKTDPSIGNRFTEPVWTTAVNQLPGFGATVDMPEHLIYISEIETCPVIDYGNVTTNMTWILCEDGTLTISGEGEMPNYSQSGSPWNNVMSSCTTVIIGDGVTAIGNSAFYGCTLLTEVTIGNSVTTIGSNAFYGCSSLTAIYVDEDNENYSSMDCVLFNKDKTTLIQYLADKKDSGYNIPNTVTTIGQTAFSGCSNLTEVTIPNSVTTIGDYAFYGCSSLTEVTIPNSVTSIGYGAFGSCSSLTEVTIPNSLTSIGNYAFRDCNSLTEVTIPNSVTTIGEGTFGDCSSLSSVTIPNSVATIGEWAFVNCSSLIEIINYSAAPQTINANVFSNVPKNTCTLYVPAGSVSAYRATAGWGEFTNIIALGSIPVVITITEQPAAVTEVSECYIADSISVTAHASQGATRAYQWFSNTSASNEGGVSIAGANKAMLAIPTNLRVGTHYFYCIVSASYEATPVASEIATVHVAPEFILAEIPPVYLNYGYSGDALSVEMACASEGLNYTYQWYSNTNESNTGGTSIPGATSANYTLPANLVIGNSYYYYCVVSAAGVAGAAKRTNAAMVIVQTKEIVVTPEAGQSKTYGAAEPTFIYTHTALTGSDVISGVLGREAGEDVGEYAFTLGTLSAGNNYTLVLTDGVSFEIAKADPSYNLPADLTTYNGYLLSTVDLPSGWSWETPDDEVGDVGTQTHKATFTPEDTYNYNVMSGIDVEVEVMEYIHVTSISFQEQYTIVAMGETKKIIFSIEPANATNKRVRWILDTEIASIDEEGWITTNSVGYTNVRVFTIDGNRQADCVIVVTRATSAEEQFLPELKIYPNPFTGELRITGATTGLGLTRGHAPLLEIIDTAGAVVHTQMIIGDDEIINLKHLPAGVYLFVIEKDGKIKTVKVLKE